MAARDCGQRRDRVFDPAELLDGVFAADTPDDGVVVAAGSQRPEGLCGLPWMRAVVSASEGMVEAMVASRYSSTLPCGWSAGPAWLRAFVSRCCMVWRSDTIVR